MKLMHKFLLSLCLFALLMLPLALAANISAAFNPVTLSPGESTTITTKLEKAGDVVYTLTDNGVTVLTETKTAAAGDSLTWTVPYYANHLTHAKPTKCLRATFVQNGVKVSCNLYYTLNSDNTVLIEKETWYTNNTACSFGPNFRDVAPNLTDKWYTFTPLDLTIQGRQEFEYVASNLYTIGKVYVDVSGDLVVVSYDNYYANQGGNTKTLSEYFSIFQDLSSVTFADIEYLPASGFAFGQPISIQRDLGGDTNVLLFICNHVTYSNYPVPTHKLVRFWPNLPERVALRTKMCNMMD